MQGEAGAADAQGEEGAAMTPTEPPARADRGQCLAEFDHRGLKFSIEKNGTSGVG
jgi:hypothetical protein